MSTCQTCGCHTPSPDIGTPEYLAVALERLLMRLVEHSVEHEHYNKPIIERLDRIMADMTNFEGSLSAFDQLVSGFSDLVTSLETSITALQNAQAAGEQTAIDAATAELQQHLDAAKATLADAQASAPSDPSAPTEPEAPADPSTPTDPTVPADGSDPASAPVDGSTPAAPGGAVVGIANA